MEEKFHSENKSIGRTSGRMGKISTVEFFFHIFISMVWVELFGIFWISSYAAAHSLRTVLIYLFERLL
jgi:hypothetical protein